MRNKQINILLKNNPKVQKNINREKITINECNLRLGLNNEQFYIEVQKLLLDILYKKKLIKIPNLQNQKKAKTRIK